MIDLYPARPICTDIALIVPTLGRPSLVGCLDSIARGDTWPGRLVVVDQGNNGAVAGWLTALTVAGLSVHHIRTTPLGIAGATNRGLRQTTTRFIAVTHDDCLVAPAWLRRLHGGLLAQPGAIRTGRVEPGGSGVVLSIKQDRSPAFYHRPLLTSDILYPNNMGFARAVYERVGGFDERPSLRLAAEDNDWAYRALRAGVPIAYDPTVVVEHLDWRDAAALGLAEGVYTRGLGGFFGKHLRRGDSFIALRTILAVGRATRVWLLGARRSDMPRRARGRQYVAELLSGIVAGWQEGPAHE